MSLCLVGAVLLTGLDLVTLYLAMAFGPTGFGGDRTWTQSELTSFRVGEVAGVVALVLALAAFAIGLSGPAQRGRVRAVAALVGAQAAAVVVLLTLAG